MKKKALITGITGQDGSYLADLLIEKGYEVHGIVRRVALEDPEHRLWRIKHLQEDIHLHAASLESFPSIYKVINAIRPDECYHLAAQSFVSYSFEDEFTTLNTNINGTHYVLSAIKETAPSCGFYFAGSSEMFGLPKKLPKMKILVFILGLLTGYQKLQGSISPEIIERLIMFLPVTGFCLMTEGLISRCLQRFHLKIWILIPRSLLRGSSFMSRRAGALSL